jgi:hypothetical protein
MFVYTETFVESELVSMETCFVLSCFLETAYVSQYCDGFAQSIARQRLCKQPATDLQAPIEGRPSLGHALNMGTQQ